MEGIIILKKKLKVDADLLKFCKVQLLSREDILNFNAKDDLRVLKINIEYDLAYDKLYIGLWNEVPEEYRRMFLVLSFLKAFHLVEDDRQRTQKQQLLKALHVVDVGIVIGSGLEECHLLTEFAQLLHEFISKFQSHKYN